MHRALGGSALALCAALAALSITDRPVAGQAAQANTYKAPRLADGRPDLNGIWQALGTANYDIRGARGAGRRWRCARARTARCRPRRARISARSARCRGGMGIVEGDEIPYKPEALAKKKENQEKWLERDPGDQVLPARACRARPTCPIRSRSSRARGVLLRLRVRGRRPQHLPEGSRARRRSTPGWASRSAAGKARRSSSTPPASTTRRGSTAPATSTATS